MDRAQASRIAHGELRLWNPLSEAALDEATGLLAPPPGGRDTLGFAIVLLRRDA